MYKKRIKLKKLLQIYLHLILISKLIHFYKVFFITNKKNNNNIILVSKYKIKQFSHNTVKNTRRMKSSSINK